MDNEQRSKFAAAWHAVERAKDPHEKVLRDLREAQDLMSEAFNVSDPVAWCENCRQPFFDNDDFVTDEDGISTCRRMTDDETARIEAPCYSAETE